MAISTLLDYAFGELELHRVGLSVFVFNEPAIATYEKLGFRKEGRYRRSGKARRKLPRCHPDEHSQPRVADEVARLAPDPGAKVFLQKLYHAANLRIHRLIGKCLFTLKSKTERQTLLAFRNLRPLVDVEDTNLV